MASLVPTKKFLVWTPPIGQVIDKKKVDLLTKVLSEVVIASSTPTVRGLSEVVVVGGGRKVLVSDVAKVAVLKYAISLNEATIEKINTDLISSTDIIESDIIGADSVPNNSVLIYPPALCRAAVFARVVSLMQCKSGVRSDVIKCLVSMLDADVVPNFSSPELAGLELCLAITGTGASCHANGIVTSSAAAFLMHGLSHVGLTAQEALTIKLGQFWSTGCACLVAAGAANMVNMMDSVAALSCDSFGANIEPFDAGHFDSCRQHRGQISSASNLRLLLQGSNRVNSPASNTSNAALAFSSIPQVNGPAQDYISTTVKMLEIELNSYESGPLTDLHVGLHPAQPLLALRSLTACIAELLLWSKSRLSTLEHMKNKTIDDNSHDHLINLRKALSLPSGISDESLISYFLLNSLSLSFATELQYCIAYLEFIEGTSSDCSSNSEVDKKEKVENFKPESDESGWTPDQRLKAEAKRKQKAEKAAQKNAAKEAKKGSAGGATKKSAILLGVGSTSIRQNIISRLKIENGVANAQAFSHIVNPFDLTDEGFSNFCVQLLEQLSSGGERRAPKVPLGTRDFGPEQMRIREQVFAAIRRIFKRHGGVEIDTPVFELKEVLTGKYGEDSKLIYDLADQGEQLLALRYDLTVPFARFLAMNSVGNIKRYHIAKVYRRDKPEVNKGRYREFYQCDFDIAGNYSTMVPDAEVITVAAEILSELPVGKFLIKLNHRKILDAVFEICGVPVDKFRSICSAVDKLDKAPWSEVRIEMIVDKGLAPEVADRIAEFVLLSGPPKDLWLKLTEKNIFGDHIGANVAMKELHSLFEYLGAMGSLPHVSFDLSLARGLDYYTGVIYEVVIIDGNSQVGSIAAGGRYDNLVGMFSSIQTPCVGVSIGIERVFTIIEKKAEELKISQASPIQVYVATIGSDLIAERMRVAKLLWTANIPAEYSHQDSPKFKKQLDDILERGIPFMVVFGEDELKKDIIKLKNMREHTEEELPMGKLVERLLALGCVVIPAVTDLGFLATLRGSYV